MDWATVAAAGAFVAGILVGAILTIRLVRTIWTTRRDLEDGRDDARRPPT